MYGDEFKMKVDASGNCIDRNTPEGQMLDNLQKIADDHKDPKMGQFISTITAYAEVAEVIKQTMPEDEAKDALKRLNDEFTDDLKNTQ